MTFDPYTQNVTFFRPDGTTPVAVAIPVIDAFNDATAIISLSYASQLGACLALLLVVLLLTPRAKLLRPTAVLHVLGLLLGVVRMALLSLYFVSPFRHFYQYWAYDFRAVPARYYDQSNASTLASLALLLVAQAALVNQAWTMAALWPRAARWAAACASAAVALLVVALKLALAVIQVHAVLAAKPATRFIWLSKVSLVAIAVSTCWFCAIFNSKLVHHLVSNRGVLPSRSALSPMEVLVMANGILMLVPVVFTALQWTHAPNLEAGSFALTSIVLVLPLGSLAASRIAHAPNIDFNPSAAGSYNINPAPRKLKSMATATTTTTVASTALTMTNTHSSGTSATRVAPCSARRSCDILEDPLDVELRHIDEYEHPSAFGRI
ncbi:hypothetical protein ESCO_005739 [Escovopsis weberi]|uniref:Pheromone alpha factor receptor n=1 Tax=Escovopsis weberi TaxID=150374 RepID=A0A0M8MV01_ESCWE|nr:hypothetical protein ESCO_005739 [Escovopsis weberi]